MSFKGSKLKVEELYFWRSSTPILGFEQIILAVGGNKRRFQRFKITRGTPFKIIFSFCNVQEVIQGVTNACKDKIQQKNRTFWKFWTRHLNLNFEFFEFFLNSKNGKSIFETKIFPCVWIQTRLIFTVLQSKYEKSIFKFVILLKLKLFFSIRACVGCTSEHPHAQFIK